MPKYEVLVSYEERGSVITEADNVDHAKSIVYKAMEKNGLDGLDFDCMDREYYADRGRQLGGEVMGKMNEKSLDEEIVKTAQDFTEMECKIKVMTIVQEHTHGDYLDLMNRLKAFINTDK